MKKTIFITGASSGIGRATALYFFYKGWNVAATMRSPEKEEELSQLEGVTVYKLDVTSQADISAVTSKIFTDHRRIDVLLNNAGYAEVGAFEKSTNEEVRAQFDVNVFGALNLTREIIPYFRKQGEGTIINVTSVGGKITFPLYSIYSASKWALEGFAESLQYELREFNIRIKNVEPGPVKTDFYSRSQHVFENEDITGYEHYEKKILGNMFKLEKKAPGPEIVAETIFKAATDGSSKLRYPAGGQAKFILFFRKIMPGHLFNKLVSKTMGRR